MFKNCKRTKVEEDEIEKKIPQFIDEEKAGCDMSVRLKNFAGEDALNRRVAVICARCRFESKTHVLPTVS